KRLIADAHAAGLRVVIDIVPNHCSDAPPWFAEALAAAPGSPQRQRFWFRPGRGEHGELPPTALKSIFGGPASSRGPQPVGAPASWVLSNHDVTRPVSRYGRTETGFSFADRRRRQGLPLDLELGAHRARAAALLCLALPGAAYLYQGEELGLWEVEDIPAELIQDPMYHRSGGADPGRDGCRVPLPWS